MFIGKVARLAGTTVKCIRHYEAIGLLPEPRREGKYRIYTQETVERLSFIKGAQQLGFKLKEMQVILQGQQAGDLPRQLMLDAIVAKKIELSVQMTQLQQMLDGLQAFERQLINA